MPSNRGAGICAARGWRVRQHAWHRGRKPAHQYGNRNVRCALAAFAA